jgi:anti-sigma factor RsiW
MTCKEAIDLLADYLEAELGPSLLTAFEQHLSTCAPCVAYLNSYRQTRTLGAAAGRVEMPDASPPSAPAPRAAAAGRPAVRRLTAGDEYREFLGGQDTVPRSMPPIGSTSTESGTRPGGTGSP